MTHPDTLQIPRAVVEQALALCESLQRYDGTMTGAQVVATVDALRAALQPQAAAEPVLWQYRWTNPAGDNQPDSVLEWKDVVPAWNQTVQDKVTELVAYRYKGKPTYEVRGLYTATALAAARVQESERWAKVCDRYSDLPAGYSAAKIRDLLGKEQS